MDSTRRINSVLRLGRNYLSTRIPCLLIPRGNQNVRANLGPSFSGSAHRPVTSSMTGFAGSPVTLVTACMSGRQMNCMEEVGQKSLHVPVTLFLRAIFSEGILSSRLCILAEIHRWMASAYPGKIDVWSHGYGAKGSTRNSSRIEPQTFINIQDLSPKGSHHIVDTVIISRHDLEFCPFSNHTVDADQSRTPYLGIRAARLLRIPASTKC